MTDENKKVASPAEEALEEAELARKNGQTVSRNSKHLIHCLSVVGQIEGHYVLAEQNKTTKYEHIIPALVAIEQDRSVEGLLIILNTVGGDVEAGLAIAELIAGMKTPTVSLVVGGGHSIGVPLAVSAKRSFIVPTASMTIHPVRMNGTVLGVPQTLSYFDKMQDRIVRFVTKNSSITEEDFREFFTRQPAKAYFILQRLCHKLRKTTEDYLDVCRTIYEAVENRRSDREHSAELERGIADICEAYREQV